MLKDIPSMILMGALTALMVILVIAGVPRMAEASVIDFESQTCTGDGYSITAGNGLDCRFSMSSPHQPDKNWTTVISTPSEPGSSFWKIVTDDLMSGASVFLGDRSCGEADSLFLRALDGSGGVLAEANIDAACGSTFLSVSGFGASNMFEYGVFGSGTFANDLTLVRANSPAPVPLPAGVGLLALGLISLGFWRKKV